MAATVPRFRAVGPYGREPPVFRLFTMDGKELGAGIRQDHR